MQQSRVDTEAVACLVDLLEELATALELAVLARSQCVLVIVNGIGQALRASTGHDIFHCVGNSFASLGLNPVV